MQTLIGIPLRRHISPRGFVALCSLLVVVSLGGCATAPPYAPQRLIPPDQLSGVQSKTIDDVTVSVAILTDQQAKTHFGADLGKEGLQVLRLRVRNGSVGRLWFIRNTLDRDLYSADEAAVLVKGQVPDDAFAALRQAFRNETVRVLLRPRAITGGFVYLPRAEGGRYVDIRLTSDAYEVDSLQSAPDRGEDMPAAASVRELRFGFALPLPDSKIDYERLDTAHTYTGMELPDLDTEELRSELEQLPCCATDASGENHADPVNVVIVGESAELLNTLSRSGWSFTHRITLGSVARLVGSAIQGQAYPVAPLSSLYLFGRKQDFALQRARRSIAQRNHMRFWLAPFTYRGQQVQVGQISRDIGIKLSTKSPSLTTHIIDPEVDLAREYLLHSLLAESLVDRFGFVQSSMAALRTQPALNLTGDPYFSDGMRLVIMLSPDPIPLVQVRSLQWEQSSAPVAGGQTEDAERYVRPIEADNRASN